MADGDGFAGFMVGLLVGTFLIAPFFWTASGRRITAETAHATKRIAKKHVERGVAALKERAR